MKKVLLILIVALAVLFHRLLLGETFFWGLPGVQFTPWREYALAQLQAGQIPFWNALNGAGSPLIANYQSGLLYPLNWLSFIVPNVGWVMSLTAVAHLLIAGAGMYRLTERMNFTALGRGVSVLAFAMTAYLVARLGTYPTITTAAWLPWLVWAVLGVLSTGAVRQAGFAALFTALMLLAGHAQTAWYSLLLAGVFALWWVIRVAITERKSRAILQGQAIRLAGLSAVILLGAGVAAFQLAATAELLGQSQRSDGAEYSFAVNYSYAPARSLNLIAPNIFGTPADGSYITEGAFFEDAAYIGLIPLISAVVAVIAWVQRKQPRANTLTPHAFVYVPFALLISVIGFVLALGRFTPIFPFLYEHVPTFDAFQAPSRWLLWTVFGLSLLAGIGVGAWRRDRRSKRFGRWALVVGIGVILATFIGGIALGSENIGVVTLIRAVLSTGILIAISGFLTIWQPQTETGAHRHWSSLVLVIVAADLVWAGWGLNPTVSGEFYAPIDTSQLEGRTYWSLEDERIARYEDAFQFKDYRQSLENWREIRASGLTNLNLLDNVASLSNFEPLLVGHYLQYIRLVDQVENPENLLRFAGVGSVYSGINQVVTIENPQRAWLGDAVCWHQTENALIAALETFDGALCNINILGDGEHETSRGNIGQVLALREYGNRVEIDIETNRQGWLVLADTDYPGWRALVDGVETPIYRANLNFRTVQVDAGAQTVAFVYQPAWALPALFISVVCGVVMIVLIRVRAVRAA